MTVKAKNIKVKAKQKSLKVNILDEIVIDGELYEKI